jgi:uncharacterized membrane protein
LVYSKHNIEFINYGCYAYLYSTSKNSAFYIFAVAAFATGMLTEMIGINTGYLFGNYQYSNVMGYKLLGVPLLIGVQWFVTVFAVLLYINYMFGQKQNMQQKE